jgi:hypothetical protein
VRELDVRWDGYSHEGIVLTVNIGPGAALTEFMEEHLRQVSTVLEELGEEIRQVIQRTGDGWQGGAADAASNAMWVLHNIDDGMHFTSNVGGIRAYGQSDNAGWVRANMPPVVEVRPPVPTGMMTDIIHVTEDYHKQQAAAKNAEQRAREIMQKYTDATRERAAMMTPLAPVPQVVLEFSAESTGRPPGGESPPRSGKNVAWPPGGGPAGPEEPVSQTRSARAAGGEAPAETGQPRGESTAASANGRPGGGEPLGRHTGPGAERGTAERTSGDGPGVLGTRGTERDTSRPIPEEVPGRRGTAGRGPGEVPGRRGVERAPGGRGPGELSGRPGGAGRAQAGIPGGAEVPWGAGMGGQRDEGKELKRKYGIPTAEHFEEDDPDVDPNREGWYVAPEVIGEPDAGGEQR